MGEGRKAGAGGWCTIGGESGRREGRGQSHRGERMCCWGFAEGRGRRWCGCACKVSNRTELRK